MGKIEEISNYESEAVQKSNAIMQSKHAERFQRMQDRRQARGVSPDYNTFVVNEVEETSLSYVKNVKIIEAYFAEGKIEKEYEEKTTEVSHTAVSGDYLGRIANILGVTLEELRNQNNLTSDEVSIGQVFSVTKIEQTEKGKNFILTKIKNAGIGNEVYIVVKTNKFNAKTLEVNIKQGKEDGVTTKNGSLKVLKEDEEVEKIEIITGEYSEKDYLNKDNFKDLAITKVTLRPKEDSELKEWNDKLEILQDKKTYLYLLVDAHTKNSDAEVTYNGTGENEDLLNEFLNDEDEWFELKLKIPIIVIDPGHGYTSGNTGSSVRKYHYIRRGTDGNPMKDESGNRIIIENVGLDDLPQYALDDMETWITGMNLERYGRTERLLVYKVVESMYNYLISNGFSEEKIHFLRRGIEDVNEGKTLRERITYSNEVKADYYISIHADGGRYDSTGAHAIHSKLDINQEESKKLAEDIMKYYTVVDVQPESPKEEEGLGIFKQTHKAKWVTLVEIGYITNPSEARRMFDNINKIGVELAKGLIENINNEFK